MKVLSASSIFNYTVSYMLDKDDYLKQMSDYALSDEGAESYKTNLFAKMSKWDIYNSTNLFNKFLDEITDILHRSHWVDFNRHVAITNLWTAIYRAGDFAKPHHHAPSFLSFVMCLEDSGHSHPLVFTDSGVEVEMHKGKIVLFPGYVNHHVPVYRNSEPRIILAGNIEVIHNINKDSNATRSLNYE